MAFCPHCGKSVGDQQTRCAACGGELEAKSKPARFKGTMMMSPGTAPLIAPPGGAKPVVAPPPAAAAPMPAPAPAPATTPTPSPLPEASVAAKPALKATMLGTGENPLAAIGAAAKAAAAHTAFASTPAPPPSTPPSPAPAAPARSEAPAAHVDPALADTARSAAAQPPRTAVSDAPAADDSKRFLIGDPMAPQQPVVRHARPQSRLSEEIPREQSGRWIAIGLVGVVVIAGLGYVAARMMGLAD